MSENTSSAEAWLENAFDREGSRLRSYLATMVGATEAEDLAHEAFTRAHGARSSYRGDVPLGAWMRRIARNVAIDHLRRASASPVSLGSATEVPDVPAMMPDPEQRAIRGQMRSCIVDLVRALPERDAEVLVLGDLRGLADQEVADALGITLGAAKIRLHRARARLRRVMERTCELYRDDDGLACDRRS